MDGVVRIRVVVGGKLSFLLILNKTFLKSGVSWKAFSCKKGGDNLPDWIKNIKLLGDLRLRYEYNHRDSTPEVKELFHESVFVKCVS